MIQLRALSDESVYTCDWGGCDDVAVAERATSDPAMPWLPVCQRHVNPQCRCGEYTAFACDSCDEPLCDRCLCDCDVDSHWATGGEW